MPPLNPRTPPCSLLVVAEKAAVAEPARTPATDNVIRTGRSFEPVRRAGMSCREKTRLLLAHLRASVRIGRPPHEVPIPRCRGRKTAQAPWQETVGMLLPHQPTVHSAH